MCGPHADVAVQRGRSDRGLRGELHPRVCAAWDLPPRTCAFEFDLDMVVELATGYAQGPEFYSMPVAKEDVALVVPIDTSAGAVADALSRGAGPLA